ncbi:type IV pilin protein [Oscillibacter sp.]|uniref:type IV pilin protein n=1 Tax=Oscillibacter sp. TaxID=1945593 RepID=UPI002D7F931B|nr:prepilin-type N-terminal cleavage/methylation domain-containing protein [Oscillibacter sp.]
MRQSKWKRQSGFTMVELLIVAAIIAVLVAVSIPMMNSVLDRARHATDTANERAALGLAKTLYSAESIFTVSASETGTNGAYLYKVDNSVGSLVPWTNSMDRGTAYGQCRTHDHGDKYLWVQVVDDGSVRLAWAKTPGGTSGISWNTGLCGHSQ